MKQFVSRNRVAFAAALVCVAAVAITRAVLSAEEPKALVQSTTPASPSPGAAMTGSTREVVTLAGGCFWSLEALYEQLRGVESVESGFSGGQVANPTYEQVSSGATGHAEVIQITFDPEVVSLRELLEVFFTVHDPTTPNRQGPDVGAQYRSVLFYRTQKQKEIAEQVIAEIEAQKVWGGPIVTQVRPFDAFYPAADYHQDYYLKNSGGSYCRLVIAPKVAKLRSRFLDRLQKE